MDDIRYTIGELAEATGVSRRTVRFYVQRGLIPPPEGAGRGSYYTGVHLDLINRIRSLQGTRVQLDAIAACPRPASAAPAPSRTIATRVTLADGIVLEFSQGVPMPDDEVLARVARLLSGTPGYERKRSDERELE